MNDQIRIRRDFVNHRDMIHLPNVSSIDTQVWSVDIGLNRSEVIELHRHLSLWLDATGDTR